jgi:hypothetical protein
MDPRLAPTRLSAVFELTILCHPCTPVAPSELEDWLQGQVDRLRASPPELIVRFCRLSHELPESEIAAGWLIQVELIGESRRDRGQLSDVLADVVTDMRFLGMQPTVLVPLDIFDLAEARIEDYVRA